MSRLSRIEIVIIAAAAAVGIILALTIGPGAVSPVANLIGSRPAPVPAHPAAWPPPARCYGLGLPCDNGRPAAFTAARIPQAAQSLGSVQFCTPAQYQLAEAFCGLVDTYPRNAWECSPQISTGSNCTGFLDGDSDPHQDNWAILDFNVTAGAYAYGPTSP